MERALLGLSGTMMVEDGTKCAEDSACFAGECLPRSTVVEKMVATTLLHLTTLSTSCAMLDNDSSESHETHYTVCNFVFCQQDYETVNNWVKRPLFAGS